MLKAVYLFVMLCHPLAIDKNYCVNDFIYEFKTFEDCNEALKMTEGLYPEEDLSCVIRYETPIEKEISYNE